MTEALSTTDMIELVDAIWGPSEPDIALRDLRLRTLHGDRCARVLLRKTNGYFNVAAGEISPTAHWHLSKTPVIPLKVLAQLLRVLRSNAQVLRKDLETNEAIRGILEDAMLDRALSVMLMTESSFAWTSHRAIFHPRWGMNESLESFIRRVYPENPQVRSDDHSRIKIIKLSASYFRVRHVQIKIVWTRFLTDHLILTDNNKTLHVFAYPGFLQTALDAIPPEHADDNVSSALQRGCLPYRLLAETMWTYDIIFPRDDRQAQSWLSKQIRDHNLDTMLSRRPANPRIHESPQDIGAPRDVASLCRRYPHWGLRLHDLWIEVNEPSLVESPVEAFAGRVHDWALANPFTSWLAKVIGAFISTIASTLGALASLLQWSETTPQQITAIIMLLVPKSLIEKFRRMVEGKRKQDCKCEVSEEPDKKEI